MHSWRGIIRCFVSQNAGNPSINVEDLLFLRLSLIFGSKIRVYCTRWGWARKISRTWLNPNALWLPLLSSENFRNNASAMTGRPSWSEAPDTRPSWMSRVDWASAASYIRTSVFIACMLKFHTKVGHGTNRKYRNFKFINDLWWNRWEYRSWMRR